MFQINCNRHGLFDDCPTIGSRGDMPPQWPLWAESRAKFGDLLDLRGALLSCELFNLPLLIDINQLLGGNYPDDLRVASKPQRIGFWLVFGSHSLFGKMLSTVGDLPSARCEPRLGAAVKLDMSMREWLTQSARYVNYDS